MSKKNPVTIVWIGSLGMGVNVVEAELIAHGTRPYAQYPAAPFVQFIPKGKRKARELQLSYEPFLMVLEGHGLKLESAGDIYGPEQPGATPGVTVRHGRHSSFSPGWANDFNAVLAQRTDIKVVADYRAGAKKPQTPATFANAVSADDAPLHEGNA